MKEHYNEPVGYGAFTPKRVVDSVEACEASEDGVNYFPSRPEPYYSLFERAKQAWDVFTYRADALYWPKRK